MVEASHYSSAIKTSHGVAKQKEYCVFAIPNKIGLNECVEALCDVVTSINITSLTTFMKWRLGPLTPMRMKMIMEDRSVKCPWGF